MQSIVDLTTCEQHGEKEKFFCEEDQRTLCESCLLAPEHKDHQVLPLETAAAKCKEKLQETLNILQAKEEELKVRLEYEREREAQYQEDTYVFKQLVLSEYEKTYQFLWNEETLYLKKLNQDFRNNLVKLQESKAKMSKEIQKLQQMTLEVEENLDESPLEMLQGLKGTLEKKKKLSLLELEAASLDRTTYTITGFREMLMSFYRDITLDPETASPHLIISEDFKRVKYGNVPQDQSDKDDNGRLDHALFVLGTQTFASGKHYWEVEVRDKTEWEVGICETYIFKSGKYNLLPEDIRTLIGLKSGDYFFLWNSENGYKASQPIHKVGIFLDYERGHVAFYNAVESSLIYSPPNVVFQGSLRPFFCPCVTRAESSPRSLIICPRSN